MTIILVHRSKAANTLSSPKSALKKLPLKDGCEEKCEADENPVVTSAEVVLEETDLVSINDAAVAQVSRFILSSMRTAHYTPRTWRTHALHLLPPEPFDWANPLTRAVFDWIFLVSALNFSFWSEREGLKSRYAVEWRAGWGREERELWTGYWTLPAAIDRALEDGIPITDPAFYADETRCPDATIAHIFRRAPCSEEDVPLLRERIAVMREVGHILVSRYEGSFMHFIRAFHSSYPTGTALDFVRLITYSFPSFADECPSPFPPPSPASPPTTLYFWKRAQILTAETWAAFYPPPSAPSSSSSPTPHPIFPNGGVRELTMFADYRVPQVLHHLGLLSYTPTLSDSLRAHEPLDHGSEAEVAIRAGSIVAVERVARCMRDMMIGAVGASASADGEVREEEEEVQAEDGVNARDEQGSVDASDVCSVLIDFYLWDLAKGAEAGQAGAVDSLRTRPILPAHRTRSIWY